MVVVAPGDSIHGKVRLDITSPWPSAAVMLGLTPTWGDPAKSYQTLSALPTPVEHAMMSFPIGLRAPAEPGRYALILAFGAEPDARWLMSGTNWSFGHPVWGDGNDLARLDPTMLRQADSRGHLVNQTVLGKDRTWRDAKIGITTIQIVVR